MKGLIQHTVGAFDPRTVPAYLDSLVAWFEARARAVAARMEEGGEEKEQGEKHTYYGVGMTLYPHLIRALEPLKIQQISNFKFRHPEDKTRQTPPITSYAELQARVSEFADTWPEFNAVITPDVEVGTDSVHIEIFYSSGDIVFTNTPRAKGSEEIKLIDEIPRSIRIWAAFRTPEAARIGLRNLGRIFKDEVAFDEVLHAIPLPYYIARLHEAASAENDELWSFHHKIGEDPLYVFEKGRGMGLSRTANVHHLKFLKPHLQALGILPLQLSYYPNFSPLGSGEKLVSVKSFDDVIDIVSDLGYDNYHNPRLLAEWNERELALDLQFYGGIARQLGAEKHFAMQVNNLSIPGTLEGMLGQVLELKSP